MRQKFYDNFDFDTPRTVADNGGHFVFRAPDAINASARNFFTFEMQRFLVR